MNIIFNIRKNIVYMEENATDIFMKFDNEEDIKYGSKENIISPGEANTV